MNRQRLISIILLTCMTLCMLPIATVVGFAATGAELSVEGWYESATVKWPEVSGATGYRVYIAPVGSESWTQLDSELINLDKTSYRADAVGLTAGEYRFKIQPTKDGSSYSDPIITDSFTVMAYDRSGYAHFNYTEGVGAYNDDGSLKDGAIVLYVTDQNKNTVSVSAKDGTTVVGIGNILNSVGRDVGGGKTAKGGKANTNSDIIRKLAREGTPLVVRFIGRVTAPEGLTAYDSVDYGGSVGDNGYMARMYGGLNITLEGVGDGAMLDGWGIHFMCQTSDYKEGIGRSFEVRNILFMNVPEDCIGMEGVQEGSTLTAPVERCWVHHCSFIGPTIANPAESDKAGGDGACDFKRGQYFTNSYCYYEGYHKTNLVGAGDSNKQYHITYHHNYWKNCESRGPLARQANIHMYNNVFEGQKSYCMNPRADAYIFSEYNLFLNSKNPVTVKSGAVKSYGDSFVNCTKDNDATIVGSRDEVVSSANRYASFELDPKLSYIPSGDYIIQENIEEMKALVIREAGHRGGDIISDNEQGGNGENNGSGGNQGSGDSGNTDKPVIVPTGSQAHSFTKDGKVDPEAFFSISGNTSTSKGSVSYNGESLTTCLKIESSTSISFTAQAGKLILVFGGSTSAAGKAIKVDGKSYDIPSSQIAEIELLAGTHVITKDDSINLFYMAFLPDEAHSHEYQMTVTEPTCTEGGVAEYICSCGARYSETLEATGHEFEDGFCIGCGMDDPDYIPDDEPADDPTDDPADDPTDKPVEKPEEKPEDKPTDDPVDDPTDEPVDEPTDDPDSTPDEEEKPLGFFEAIWKAIVDFFKWLFGIKE